MAIPAAILTIFVGVNAYTAWGYWHQSDSFRRTQRSWSTFIEKRWLLESLPRMLPSTVLTGAVFVLACWCAVISQAFEGTAWEGGLLIAFAVGLALTALLAALLDPLVLFFNVPSFLVAPHDRGKPGGLELRRRYRER